MRDELERALPATATHPQAAATPPPAVAGRRPLPAGRGHFPALPPGRDPPHTRSYQPKRTTGRLGLSPFSCRPRRRKVGRTPTRRVHSVSTSAAVDEKRAGGGSLGRCHAGCTPLSPDTKEEAAPAATQAAPQPGSQTEAEARQR